MKRNEKRNEKDIKNALPTVFRAMYFYITGHLLLLISAISERGETELSRILIPKPYQTGEMIETVICAMTVLCAGWLLMTYIIEKEKYRQ